MKKIQESEKVKRTKRRKNQRRVWNGRYIFISVVILFLLLLIGFGPLSGLFQAETTVVEANQQLSGMKYKVIQIEKGDSLWSIAKDNMSPGFSDIYEYIYEIKECNQLESDCIISGNYLMVPYYEDISSNTVVMEE